MTVDPIPEDVVSFVHRDIDSIADLEALLLVRERPDARWTIATIAARLYIAEPHAAEVMERLRVRNFVVAEDAAYRYTASPARDPLIRALAALYRTHLIQVTHLIHSKSTSRIRQFADAFKFRKEK